HLPFSMVLAIITLLLISTFFITSADSATYVLGMQTSYGSLNPPNYVKIIWGLVLSASAVILMSSGGLQGFQTAIIVSAFPLAIILLLMTLSLLKSFHAEKNPKPGQPATKDTNNLFEEPQKSSPFKQKAR